MAERRGAELSVLAHGVWRGSACGWGKEGSRWGASGGATGGFMGGRSACEGVDAAQEAAPSSTLGDALLFSFFPSRAMTLVVMGPEDEKNKDFCVSVTLLQSK